MAPAAAKRRKSKRKTQRDWYLVALVGLAVLVLGSFLWIRFHAGAPGQQESEIDFADRLRLLAAERGVDEENLAPDDPIRKVDGVFVRTWRFSLPNRAAMEALERDILAAAGEARGSVSRGPADVGESRRRMRVDFQDEAFDLQLATAPRRYQAEAGTVSTPEPTMLPTATPRPRPSPGARGLLAVLLDDAGQSLELLPQATALPEAVGVAVLPFLPHTRDIAVAMHESGHEVWLHLPMEPEGYPKNNPGPGAILVAMSDAEIRQAVHDALNNVPRVIGVNNHMGSRATADLRTMTWVMQELKSRGMAFIDSRTTRNTVAEQAALAQGVPAGRRHVFLDNERSAVAIARQLAEAVYRSRLQGSAIAIGHLDGITIEVLQSELASLSKRGADLVAPSQLVR
jgi:polysaccharide deacetylase 2 family uncharacterized protein YibQ